MARTLPELQTMLKQWEADAYNHPTRVQHYKNIRYENGSQVRVCGELGRVLEIRNCKCPDGVYRTVTACTSDYFPQVDFVVGWIELNGSSVMVVATSYRDGYEIEYATRKWYRRATCLGGGLK